MKKNKGFSLVETLVASTIALLLSIVIWSLFSGSIRLFSNAQQHLEAMQVAQFIVEMVENDIHSLVLRDNEDQSVLSSMEARSKLEFFVCQSGQDSGNLYKAKSVKYSIVRCYGGYCLKKNDKIYHHLPIKKLTFKPVEIVSFDGKASFFLQTIVTGTDQRRKDDFTLVSQVALDVITKARLFPKWKHNDSEYVTF